MRGPGRHDLHVLLFDVAGQRAAVPTAAVRQVVRGVPPVRLSAAPGVVHGVIDVRGALVPVYDVRARLGFPSRPVRHDDHLILATAGSRTVALHVDSVVDVAVLGADDVEGLDEIVPGASHLAGVATLADGLVLVADLEAFLSAEEATALEQALEEGVDGVSLGEGR